MGRGRGGSVGMGDLGKWHACTSPVGVERLHGATDGMPMRRRALVASGQLGVEPGKPVWNPVSLVSSVWNLVSLVSSGRNLLGQLGSEAGQLGVEPGQLDVEPGQPGVEPRCAT
eukprot:365308-Chlamydomonas_euryale.AAC.2